MSTNILSHLGTIAEELGLLQVRAELTMHGCLINDQFLCELEGDEIQIHDLEEDQYWGTIFI